MMLEKFVVCLHETADATWRAADEYDRMPASFRPCGVLCGQHLRSINEAAIASYEQNRELRRHLGSYPLLWCAAMSLSDLPAGLPVIELVRGQIREWTEPDRPNPETELEELHGSRRRELGRSLRGRLSDCSRLRELVSIVREVVRHDPELESALADSLVAQLTVEQLNTDIDQLIDVADALAVGELPAIV